MLSAASALRRPAGSFFESDRFLAAGAPLYFVLIVRFINDS